MASGPAGSWPDPRRGRRPRPPGPGHGGDRGARSRTARRDRRPRTRAGALRCRSGLLSPHHGSLTGRAGRSRATWCRRSARRAQLDRLDVVRQHSFPASRMRTVVLGFLSGWLPGRADHRVVVVVDRIDLLHRELVELHPPACGWRDRLQVARLHVVRLSCRRSGRSPRPRPGRPRAVLRPPGAVVVVGTVDLDEYITWPIFRRPAPRSSSAARRGRDAAG